MFPVAFALCKTLADEILSLNAWFVADFEAEFVHGFAVVDFFKPDEITLVEAALALEGGFGDGKEGAADGIDGLRLGVVKTLG